MKAAVFVSAGLGDALLLVPLVKELKKRGNHVSGIFTSPFRCEELFYGTTVFDEIMVLPESYGAAALSSLQNLKRFDVAYLNFFSATRKNLLLAGSISKKIITNNPEAAITRSSLDKLLNMEVIKPAKGIHDSTQNLRLLDASANDSSISEDVFMVDFPGTALPSELSAHVKTKYFAVQISSGNNIQKYKNWTTGHWIDFLLKAAAEYSGHNFILLGDPNETEIAASIQKAGIPNIHSTVGKTKIREAVEIVRQSAMFIGLDGGLMHIAAALGKPTFTLWGPSDFKLYGYHKINPSKHHVVYQEISCRPCNSWISPNTSRVKNPVDCPDYICMQNLKPQLAFSRFREFYNKLTLA